MKRDIDKALDAAEALDKRECIYNNSIRVRARLQKLMQKAEQVRSHCLQLKKMGDVPPDGEKQVNWCPDGDYAFRCQCDKLGAKDSCSNPEDCVLCSKN